MQTQTQIQEQTARLLANPDPHEIASIEDEECRRHLEPFLERVFATLIPRNPFKPNWHIGLICEYLEALYLGQIRKLIINEPPRFLKSLPVSIAFPAWVLGKQPSERFLCASYAAPLSTEFSLHCRRVVESFWYQRVFPGTKLASDQNQKTWFDTTEHGYRISTSVGGSATGRGGNYKILDDPIDPERAFSVLDTASAIRWIDQVWSSRDDDPKLTREVVVMQRLSINDPTAHLLKQGGWEMLKIQQEAKQRVTYSFPISGQVKVREAGELLHPEYFGQEQVEVAKVRLGEYGYAGQHQQEPTALGGNLVKDTEFRRYAELPSVADLEELVLSIDTANKDQVTNAPTCLGAWAVYRTFPERLYLLEVISRHWKYPELKQGVLDYLQSCPERWGSTPSAVIIEDKASGIQLIQDLQTSTAYNVISMDPTGEGDKLVRFSTETPAFRAGRVWIPESASWVFNYVAELTAFPNCTFKDQVDMTSQYLRWKREPQAIFIG